MPRGLLISIVGAASLAACTGKGSGAPTEAPTAPPPRPVVSATPARPTPPTTPATTPTAATPTVAEGEDYIAQARALYRVAACAGTDPVPAPLSAKDVDRYCKEQDDRMARYRKRWLDKADAFIATIRPPGLPTTVVYPFGGGDLMTALTVFPDATEITTISLEAVGDPRAITTMKRGELKKELDQVGFFIARLLYEAYSTTQSLQTSSHGQLPGLLVFHMVALATHGYEPVSLRYFQLNEDGSLHYLSQAELDTLEASEVARVAAQKDAYRHRKVKVQGWHEQVAVYENVEIRFRKAGDASAPIKTYRHIVANLDDEHQGKDGRLIKHLEQKGHIAAMTKAASFLLWFKEFSIIRDYLLAHVDWMISDTSGIPPSYAVPAGFEQVPYGTFTGPYFSLGQAPADVPRQFLKLWQKSEKKDLGFRFGYPDGARNGHLMVTRRLAPAATPSP